MRGANAVGKEFRIGHHFSARSDRDGQSIGVAHDREYDAHPILNRPHAVAGHQTSPHGVQRHGWAGHVRSHEVEQRLGLISEPKFCVHASGRTDECARNHLAHLLKIAGAHRLEHGF